MPPDLAASSTAVSEGISAPPDDTNCAVADKLMNVNVGLGITLVVISLEKYLLTISGFRTFITLVPIGSACLAAAVALLGRSVISRTFAHVAVRLLPLDAILASVAPVSVWVTDRVGETYEAPVVVASTEQEAQSQDGRGRQGSSSSSRASPMPSPTSRKPSRTA